MARIFGLAKLISTLILVCKVIDAVGSPVRAFVPEGSQSAYDTALTQIKNACDIVRAINFLDDVVGTEPMWGTKD